MKTLLLAALLALISIAAQAGDTTYAPVQVAQFFTPPGPPPPGVSGPFCQDTFTGTANTKLDAHTPNIGGGWTALASDSNNYLALDGSGSLYGHEGGSVYPRYICNATPNSADETISVQIDPQNGADWTAAILCRVQDLGNMYDAGRVHNGSGSLIYIAKRISDTTDNALTSIADPSGATSAVFTFTCKGTGSVNLELKAPTLSVDLTFTDSSSPYNSAGHVGLSYFNDATPGNPPAFTATFTAQ